MQISARSILEFLGSPKNIFYYVLPVAIMLASFGWWGAENYLLNRYDRQFQELTRPSAKDSKAVSCTFSGRTVSALPQSPFRH